MRGLASGTYELQFVGYSPGGGCGASQNYLTQYYDGAGVQREH